jgi:3-hydroxyisobutyrate dehydrogenase-like beta-hydroxyacid dehydrogenase
VPTERAVGVIGLGLVGRALAARLTEARFEVIGFDKDAVALSSFEGRKASAAVEVAKSADRIVLAVFDTADVEQVAAEAKPKLFIDCTTGDPVRMEALAKRLAAEGIGYVEAPLSGSSDTIRQGEGLMLVAGDASGCEDLLAAMSPRRRHVGPIGTAVRLKLATNLVLGLSRVALAEGMVFAEAQGIDRATFLEILKGSPAASPAALAKGAKMASRRFDAPDSRIKQHLKDVERILEYARRAQLPVPFSEMHARLLRDAVAAGEGELDNAAIIRRWRTE